MGYTPQTWADTPAGGTPISAARLTYIEAGLQAAAAVADAAASNTSVVHLAGAETITGPKTLGPLSDVNAKRLTIYAEATGQVANVFECYSGTDKGQGGQRQLTLYANEKGELRLICARSDSTGVRFKAQSGQSVNVLEITDISNNAKVWCGPDFSWRAPNLGQVLALSVVGAITGSTTGAHRIYNDSGVTLTIRAVRASLGTAPTGQAAIIDVNRNGSTIFATQANRPTIPVSQNTSGKVTNMDTTTLADGDFLTVDIDQAGSVVAGADLVLQVLTY